MSDWEESYEMMEQPRTPAAPLPRNQTPIVPQDSIGGRALVAVVAIMTFLASLTTGAVMMVRASANDWQSEVAREVTIQVRPVSGRDLEGEVKKASDIARSFAGISDVRPFTREESARLLEPWLGKGLALEDLPVPRVIVVKLSSDIAVDLAALRRRLTEQVPGASLDDHRGWIDRMRAMTGAAVAGGIVILLLVLAATILSVAFATRGAMAANRPIIEVLHFIGARDGFIARQFQRHFLVLGLKGGFFGGGAAIVIFLVFGLATTWLFGSAGADQFALLFGTFSIGWEGYLLLVMQILLVAVATAWTSRQTVHRTLAAV